MSPTRSQSTQWQSNQGSVTGEMEVDRDDPAEIKKKIQQQWRANGKPRCTVLIPEYNEECGGTHPEQLHNPELAKKGLETRKAFEHLQQHCPGSLAKGPSDEELAASRKEKNKLRKDKQKETKKASKKQGEEAEGSSKKRKATEEPEVDEDGFEVAKTKKQKKAGKKAEFVEQKKAEKKAENAEYPFRLREICSKKHSGKCRACPRCGNFHTGKCKAKLRPKKTVAGTGQQGGRPSFAQVAGQSFPTTPAPPQQQGQPMPFRDVARHLGGNITTQQGLENFAQLMNDGPLGDPKKKQGGR